MQRSKDGFRLEEMEAFAAVAESGGFATAAKRLGRDASVVSRRVVALEARLGVRLLARTTRRISVTEAGTAYLRRVQVILAELAAADGEAMDQAAAPRGLLRLALPAAFGRIWIVPLLPGFLASHPAIRVEVRLADRVVDVVAEGFDAAVRIGTLSDSGLVVRSLAPLRRLLCASPGYLLARGSPDTPDALARHTCLGFTGLRSWPDWPLRRGTERVSVRVDCRVVSDDSEALTVACVGGAGVMVASDWLVGRELADGRLVRVLPDWSLDEGDTLNAVLPPGRLVPAKTRAFVDWVAAAFTPPPPWSQARSRQGSVAHTRHAGDPC